MTEPLDVFDDNYKHIGIAESTLAHKSGLWHRVAHCWVIDSNTGAVLYQRRSHTKRLYPNMLDVSAAGHCRAGESPSGGAIRESLEELGLVLSESELIPLGTRRDCYSGTGTINREFQHIFFALKDLYLPRLALPNAEVSGVLLVPPQDVINTLKQGTACTSIASFPSNVPASISPRDFIPSIDGYNVRIPMAALQILHGSPPPFI